MGLLNLKPSEFWASTPAEIFYLAQGYVERNREDLEKYAVLACWIVNQSGWRSGKPLRVSDLMKPRGAKIDPGITSEGVKKMLDDAARYQKGKAWTKLSDKYAKKEDEI